MFSNLLVVDMSSVLAGPLVGQFFAELGARVIKIENARTSGDVTRGWKLATEDANSDLSAYYLSVNAGKESIALDLKLAVDRELCFRMLERADVLIHNFKPGDAQVYGLEYEQLCSRFPRLIHAAVSGYGAQDSRVGYDAVIQAETGYMAMNGQPGALPTKLPVALMDVLTAQQLRQAILLALMHRERSGEGSKVHCSLLKAGISSLVNQASNVLNADFEPQQSGSDHPNIVPYGTLYATRDERYIMLAVGSDRQFQELCQLLGIGLRDEFATNQLRVQHRDELQALISTAIAKHDSKELLQRLREKSIPCACINSVGEALELPAAQDLQIVDERGIGLRSVAFEASFLEMRACNPAPHYNEHSQSLRNEFSAPLS